LHLQDEEGTELKHLDINVLTEVYQILVETAQFVISNRRESSIKEIINFLKNLKDAIDQNLSENTFEDQSENESQIMKLEMDASLFLNISCYY
jgi:hypothetical protein